MSNYCILENRVLLIKNHIWFWQNKKYPLEKIASVEYTHRPKIGFGLIIKLKNLPARFHGLNGLREKEFTKIYYILKANNIKVKGFNIIAAELN